MLANFLSQFAATCNPTSGDFLGFPKWYKYLDGLQESDGSCSVHLDSLSDVWKIAVAIFELLLRLGALVAVFFIIWGSFNLIMAQGEPERVKAGKGTITNAVVGLVISLMAATIVAVVARRLT